jgi:anti-sigma B factor antagonist
MSSAAIPDDERSSASCVALRTASAHLVEEQPSPGELRVAVSRPSNGLCVVSLSGEMDMSNASDLPRALRGNVGPGRMIIELSRLTFMDSTGINQLVTISRTVKVAGGALVLAAPHPNLARLFEIVNLGELMPVATSLAAEIDLVPPTTTSLELV